MQIHHGKQRGQLATPKSHHPPERGKRWIDYHSWGIWELIKIFYHNQPQWWDKLQSSDQLPPPPPRRPPSAAKATLKKNNNFKNLLISSASWALHLTICCPPTQMSHNTWYGQSVAKAQGVQSRWCGGYRQRAFSLWTPDTSRIRSEWSQTLDYSSIASVGLRLLCLLTWWTPESWSWKKIPCSMESSLIWNNEKSMEPHIKA